MGQAKKLSLCRISKTEFPINVSSSPINMFKHLKMPSFQNQHTCKGYNYFLEKLCSVKQVFFTSEKPFLFGKVSSRYQAISVAFHFLNKHKPRELHNESKKGSEFDIKKVNPEIACLNDKKQFSFKFACLQKMVFIQEGSNEVLFEPKNCPKTKILHSYCTYCSTFYSKEGKKEPADCET